MYKRIVSKKGFLLRDVIVAAIFGIGIISLFVLVIGGMAQNYNRSDLVNTQFAANYDNLNRLTGETEDQRNAVTNSSAGTSLVGTGVSFNSFFTIVTLVWTSVDIFGQNAASVISDYTFLSPAVIKVLFTILLAGLVTTVVWIIISSVTRGRV